MKFLPDENFPKSVGRFLERSGHEVVDVRSTTDRDFFHIIPHLYKKHCGVIVIALKQPARRQIQSKIEWLMQNFEVTKFKNRVLLLRDQHFTQLTK